MANGVYETSTVSSTNGRCDRQDYRSLIDRAALCCRAFVASAWRLVEPGQHESMSHPDPVVPSETDCDMARCVQATSSPSTERRSPFS